MQRRIVFLLAFFLMACQATVESPTASQISPTITQTSATDQQSEFVVPNPTSQTGVIVGQLLTPGSGGKPYIATLYLGTFIYPENNADGPPLITFSEHTSLQGVQDQQTGRFYFADVPPGKYAIIIWTPVMSMPLRDAKTQTEITFEVKAGEITDLGIIAIP